MTIGVKQWFAAKKAKADWTQYVDTVVGAARIARQAKLDEVLQQPIPESSKIGIGTRVAYSVQFLRAIGEAPCGELCHWRGEVVEITPLGEIELATVQWDDMPSGFAKRGDAGHPSGASDG